MPHIHDKYDFTVSAFILHPTEDRILLHRHRKLNKWLQPGGHVELDEDPMQALEHELSEETGLILGKCAILLQPSQPTIHESGYKTLPIPFHKMVHDFFPDGSHKHIDDSYLLRSYTDKLEPNEGESQELDWFNIEQIREFSEQDEVFHSTIVISEWIAANVFKVQ